MLLSERFHQNCQAAFGHCKHLWVKSEENRRTGTYIFSTFSSVRKGHCSTTLLINPYARSVIDTKESDGIDDPMEKIGIKSHSDHSDSGIGKMLILIDAYFVILFQCNKMTK